MQSLRISTYLLFLSISLNAQHVRFDHISFQSQNDSTVAFYKNLNVRDTSSVVVLITRVGLWSYGVYSDCFIFKPNGNVQCIEEFRSNQQQLKKSYLKKYSIKNDCKDSIYQILENQSFAFNKDSLNVMPEPIIESDTTVTYINTWDGLHYNFFVMKGDKYSDFSMHSPEPIIQAKRAGYDEKQKLLELIESFDKIKSCASK